MKQKLLMLREKLVDKLRSVLFIFNPILSKVAPAAILVIRKFLTIGLIPVLSFVFLIYGVFVMYPAYELKGWLSRQLAQELQAEEVFIGDLKWDHKPLSLSLGLIVDELSIRDGAWVQSAKIGHIRVGLSPLGFLFSETPVQISAQEFSLELEEVAQEDANKVISSAEEEAGEQSPVLQAAEFLTSNMRGYLLDFKNGTVVVDFPSFGKAVTLTDFELDAVLGSSAAQQVDFHGTVDLADDKGRWAVGGPVIIKTESRMVKSGGVPVSLEFEKFEADFSELAFSALQVFERLGKSRFDVSGTPRVVFTHENGYQEIEKVLFEKATIDYDDLKIGFRSEFQPRKELKFEWLIGRSDVQSLKLPIVGLRRSPGKGVVSSNGYIKIRDEFQRAEGQWSLMLNNFRTESQNIAGLLGNQESLKGELKISGVSEGRLNGGVLETPRTELQIDASKMRVELLDGNFVKPPDRELSLLFRVKKEKERLKLEDITLKLHTLHSNLVGHIDRPILHLLGIEDGAYDLRLKTNNIDLSEWSAFFPCFRKIPLQGFAHVSTDLEGPLFLEEGKSFAQMQWNVSKLHFSNIKGSIESDLSQSLKDAGYDDRLLGPFTMSLYFVGRGFGPKVQRANLMFQSDFSEASVFVEDMIRKPIGVPMNLQVSLNQMPNKLSLERGFFEFGDLRMIFSGDLLQGSQSTQVNVGFQRPVDLGLLRPLILDKRLSSTLEGKWGLNGAIRLADNLEFEKSIDWSSLFFEGEVSVTDGALASRFMRKPIENLTGRLEFQKDSIEVREISFSEAGTAYSLSGSIKPMAETGGGSGTLSLGDWMATKSWDINGQVSVPQLELTSLLDASQVSGDYLFAESWTKGEFFKNSSMDIALSSQQVAWIGREIAQDLNAKLALSKGRLQLRPMSLAMDGGKITGNYTVDFNPLWSGKESPEQGFSLKLSNVPSSRFPRSLGLVGARLSGELQGVTAGNFLSDWREQLSASLSLTGTSGGESLHRANRALMSRILENSKARDYMISDARKRTCLSEQSSVRLEARVQGEGFDTLRLQQGYGAGGQVELSMAPWNFASGPQQEEPELQEYLGSFTLPTNCLSAKGQRCLSRFNGKGAIPLRASVSQDLKYDFKFNEEAFGESFASCMAQETKKEVEKRLSQSR